MCIWKSFHGMKINESKHMVTSPDKLKFGLTCHYVKAEMVPEEMRNMGDLGLDPANAYDGDLQLYEDTLGILMPQALPETKVSSRNY